MSAKNATALRAQISAARVVPYRPDTATLLGGGARGRTLSLIYAQLSYWSKYAKWTGSGNRRFFYKSARELAEELGYSTKTIQRAIKELKKLGFIIVERLHKHFYRQVNFFYLPHSPYASAEPVKAAQPAEALGAPRRAEKPAEALGAPRQAEKPRREPESSPNPNTPIRRDTPSVPVLPQSFRARGTTRGTQNVPIKQREYIHSRKHTFEAIFAKCLNIQEEMKRNGGQRKVAGGFI
jgi:DNA-binding CsgD family transcriptional regulator